MVWKVLASRSKSVVDSVAKHAGNCRMNVSCPSGQLKSDGARVGDVVGPDVGEVVGASDGWETIGLSVGS